MPEGESGHNCDNLKAVCKDPSKNEGPKFQLEIVLQLNDEHYHGVCVSRCWVKACCV